MKSTKAEYRIVNEGEKAIIYIRKQNRDLSRYFGSYTIEEPLTEAVLCEFIKQAEKKLSEPIDAKLKEIGKKELIITTDCTDPELLTSFIDAFLDELGRFYEQHEIHITRMFGSFVLIKRINGELQAVKATPVPLRYCPLMRQLLKEVGGKAAESFLASVESGDASGQTEKMCDLINEIVIRGGFFDTSRPLNSCEANVLFGASETMSTAFRSGIIDAAVIVSNNLGTIITTDSSNTQGAVKRMTGLFLSSPSEEIMKTAAEAGIIPVFPHTALIDQLEGVKLAISLGYKKIAVSVAWMDNLLLDEISKLEKDGVTIYRFGLCSTGIDDSVALSMEKHADLIWSCASKVVRRSIEPNAIAQVGVKIPVHIMSDKGWKLVQNHLELTTADRSGKSVSFKDVKCQKGKDKPVILNDGNEFRVISSACLTECTDCPHPCV